MRIIKLYDRIKIRLVFNEIIFILRKLFFFLVTQRAFIHTFTFAFQKLMTISSSLVETQNTDTTEATVNQHFAHLHGVLQNVEKRIINSLRKHKDFKRKNIDAISSELRKYEEQLQSALVVRIRISVR